MQLGTMKQIFVYIFHFYPSLLEGNVRCALQREPPHWYVLCVTQTFSINEQREPEFCTRIRIL